MPSLLDQSAGHPNDVRDYNKDNTDTLLSTDGGDGFTSDSNTDTLVSSGGDDGFSTDGDDVFSSDRDSNTDTLVSSGGGDDGFSSDRDSNTDTLVSSGGGGEILSTDGAGTLDEIGNNVTHVLSDYPSASESSAELASAFGGGEPAVDLLFDLGASLDSSSGGSGPVDASGSITITDLHALDTMAFNFNNVEKTPG